MPLALLYQDTRYQENGTHANVVSILTGTTKSRFSRICSSVMAYPNGIKFTVELASMKGRPRFKFYQDPLSRSWDMSQQNFVKISSFFSSLSFRTLCKNRHNSCVRASILLKFDTRIGGLKANTSINFWVNLINIEVISDFMQKSKSNFCQAYRVNRFEEQSENRYVARLSIRDVPFGG